MTHYTVIGYYENTGQIWADNCDAESHVEAAKICVRYLLESNGWDESSADQIAVVEVLEGSPVCCGITESVAYGKDILEL